MYQIVPIKISDLRLDENNARLGEPQDSQPATMIALAQKQGKHFIPLVRDIVEHGIDPTTLTIVVPTRDTRRRYVVLEGNRRVLALKALETPAVVSGALTPTDQRTLETLSKKYLAEPYDEIDCVLFPSEADAGALDLAAAHWSEQRCRPGWVGVA